MKLSVISDFSGFQEACAFDVVVTLVTLLNKYGIAINASVLVCSEIKFLYK